MAGLTTEWQAAAPRSAKGKPGAVRDRCGEASHGERVCVAMYSTKRET